MKSNFNTYALSCLVLFCAVSTYPEKQSYLDKYSYQIEHWFDNFLKDVELKKQKMPSSDEMMEKMQKGLRKTIDFSKTTPRKLQSFMTEKKDTITKTRTWLKYNYTNLKTTIETFFAQHPHAELNDLYAYLNESNNPVCRALQKTMHSTSTAPWIINNAINNMIEKIKNSKK